MTAAAARAGNIVLVVGNPRTGSRTSRVGAALADRLGARAVEPVHIELADFASELFEPRSGCVEQLIAQAVAADVLVVASPTYKATYTGLLKAFLDRFPPGGLGQCFAVPAMVAASRRHAGAVDTYLSPLLLELGATVPARGLFVTESDVDNIDQVIDSWSNRTCIAQMAADPAQVK